MTRKPRFDVAEATARRAAGETLRALAAEFGVTVPYLRKKTRTGPAREMNRLPGVYDEMATCGRCSHAKRWHRRGPCAVVQGQCQCHGFIPATWPTYGGDASWMHAGRGLGQAE